MGAGRKRLDSLLPRLEYRGLTYLLELLFRWDKKTDELAIRLYIHIISVMFQWFHRTQTNR
jgi:hypothetical protein